MNQRAGFVPTLQTITLEHKNWEGRQAARLFSWFLRDEKGRYLQ